MRFLIRVFIVIIASLALGVVGNLVHPRGIPFVPPPPAPEATQCMATSVPLLWVTVSQVHDLSHPLVIADLRSKEAYALEHIAGAVHLPCYEATGQTFLGNLPKGTTVLFYDEVGTVSEQTAENARRLGLIPYALKGGFAEWKTLLQETQPGICTHCESAK